MRFLKKISKAIRRSINHRRLSKVYTKEYCPSCNKNSYFLVSEKSKEWLSSVIDAWKLSDEFKNSLLERENFFCSYCGANYRMRAHAETVLKVLGMPNSKAIINKLKDDLNFVIYETAAYNIFRINKLKKYDNYVVSEFFDNAESGSYVNGIRNENLECLSFPDNYCDVIINSDVLEHVSDLDKTLSEIKRILKPGGYHLFTVPVDHNLAKTRERARVVNGNIVHLLEPITHGDTIRGEGILAYRDFGNDILEYTSRINFECAEYRYYHNNRYITSVYFAQKR